MLRYFSLILLVFVSGFCIKGQTPQQLKDNYERETVYWKGGKILKGDRKLKLKYFKVELLKFQDSKFEFEQYRRYEKQAWIEDMKNRLGFGTV